MIRSDGHGTNPPCEYRRNEHNDIHGLDLTVSLRLDLSGSEILVTGWLLADAVSRIQAMARILGLATYSTPSAARDETLFP